MVNVQNYLSNWLIQEEMELSSLESAPFLLKAQREKYEDVEVLMDDGKKRLMNRWYYEDHYWHEKRAQGIKLERCLPTYVPPPHITTIMRFNREKGVWEDVT